MHYELISEEEYAGLSSEDDKCFVEFENICRRNMTRMIDQDTSADFDNEVREQYMVAVSKVAEACSIPNISYNPETSGDFSIVFSRFCLAVQGEVTQIRIKSRGNQHPYSVILSGSTRTKIEHYVSRIRDLIDNGDIDSERKKRLHKKLDELSGQLSDQRLSFAKTMAILAAITAALGSTITIAADGPSAITHIMRLIGEDKETEEAATRRLAGPPKALPAPPAKHQTFPRQPRTRVSADLIDDDIPF